MRPQEITVSKADRAQVRKLLDSLDTTGPVPVAAGKYGKWAHAMIRPDSPMGKLLTLQWTAVPTLLEELEKRDLSESRRARVLALLFSITGRNNPRRGGSPFGDASILGDNIVQQGPWVLTAGANGNEFSAGWSDPSFNYGRVDVEKQKAFARRWQNWKKYLVVREPAVP